MYFHATISFLSRTHAMLILGAPLIAGTDVIDISPEILAILTAREVIEVNEDLGANGALQGQLLRTNAQTTEASVATMQPCDGSASQSWQIFNSSISNNASYLKNKATSKLLNVPNCTHAPLAKPFTGPKIGLTNSSGAAERSSCSGDDLMWTFQSNGTITSSVDGQCLNIYAGSDHHEYGVDLHLFSCQHQGSETNGKFIYKPTEGSIESKMFQNHCLTAGQLTTNTEIWAKPLADGKRTAVVLLNMDASTTVDIRLDWTVIGLPSSSTAAVRDLWLEKDLGAFTGHYTAEQVPPHGVNMIIVALN